MMDDEPAMIDSINFEAAQLTICSGQFQRIYAHNKVSVRCYPSIRFLLKPKIARKGCHQVSIHYRRSYFSVSVTYDSRPLLPRDQGDLRSHIGIRQAEKIGHLSPAKSHP
jgi:hypothetical protein